MSKAKRGSLKFYEREWMQAMLAKGKVKSGEAPPLVKALAQLSYENEALRKRVDIAERLLFAMTTGMVLGRDGSSHLLGCAIRDGDENECDCGSSPQKG